LSLSASPRPEQVDRLEPARRPPGRPVMFQTWSHLLFLHWPVDADSLAWALPPGLELDTFQGKAYVGLVPFTMSGIRPAWAPALPGISEFHEVNVRTYVHYQGRDPGVWFFSLDAANRLAVRMARICYHLPYYYAWMRLETRPAEAGEAPEVSYASVRRGRRNRAASCALTYQPRGIPAPAAAGSLDHFLLERYILYSYARGRLYSGRVHHGPYPAQQAVIHSVEENMLAAAGITPAAVTPLVHYASGVNVEIFPIERVDTPGH
jgi:uncharacterized protein